MEFFKNSHTGFSPMKKNFSPKKLNGTSASTCMLKAYYFYFGFSKKTVIKILKSKRFEQHCGFDIFRWVVDWIFFHPALSRLQPAVLFTLFILHCAYPIFAGTGLAKTVYSEFCIDSLFSSVSASFQLFSKWVSRSALPPKSISSGKYSRLRSYIR